MKFPSLHTLVKGFISVVRRFPLESLSAFTGTTTAIFIIFREQPEEDARVRLLLCSLLGLVLFLSVSVGAEARNGRSKTKVVMQLLAAGVLVVIYFFVQPITHEINLIRFALLIAAFHLLVAFAPFISRGSVEGFWEYNKQLFLRILASGLYSGVLFAGLAIAIASTDALFDLNIDEKIYGYLFCTVAGLFNTLFFLAGIPEQWQALDLEENQQYPKGLKVFTQYVLIPLATVYLAILLAYEIKLVTEWLLPKGLVSSLVLGYAVYGILSILLVYPIRFDEGNRWIRIYVRLFYVLLIPLIVLLGIAIGIRVNQYGITESRYMLMLLCMWLAGITVYFLVSRLPNIKMIPISLFVLALLAVWGPQSAGSLSLSSQVNRLTEFFQSHQAIAGGKWLPLADSVKSHEAADILDFLVHRYGTKPLQPLLSVNLDSLLAPADTITSAYSRRYEQAELLRHYLGLRYDYQSQGKVTYYSAQSEGRSIPLQGHQFMIAFHYPDGNDSSALQLDSVDVHFTTDSVKAHFNLGPLVHDVAMASGNDRLVTRTPGQLSVTSTDSAVTLVIKHLYFRKDSTTVQVQSIEGYLLFK
jgi:hypothetical protein